MASPHNHEIVSLHLLRSADSEAVAVASSCLLTEGFVFLSVSDDADIVQVVLPNVKVAADFFQGKGKGSGSKINLDGHISGSYKDSLRLLSGNQSNFESIPVPGLKELVRMLDKAAIEVAKALANPLFGCSDETELGDKFGLPLLDPEAEDPYGMVDIASYRNEAGAPDVVVSEHFDPGLLILSLPGLGEGLELRDSTGKWVSPPKDHGVLWAGTAAKEAGVAAGLHRVRSTIGKPRVGCWHEICTSSQISPPMLKKLKERGSELEMGSVKGTMAVLETLRKAEDLDPVASRLFGAFFGYQRIKPVPSTGGVPGFKVEVVTVTMPVRTGRRDSRQIKGQIRRGSLR